MKHFFNSKVRAVLVIALVLVIAFALITNLTEFDLPIRLTGTDFRMQCWQALLTIPYGATISYGEQARRIGKPKAVRAVGGANHHNPISIVVPCHRVIGADGSLTGYGGGLDVKAWLLAHEQQHRIINDGDRA